jgi:6-phosphofructokinase
VDTDGTAYYSSIRKVVVQYNNFHIWPNPANDVVYIDNNSTGLVNCSIIASTGQHIKNIQLHGGTNTVDVRGLPSGTYVFAMQTNSGIDNKIVVKQ